ncbi:MAG: universal stress protein [Actinomycetes bacterium]
MIVDVAADVSDSARDGPQVILAATDDSTTGLRAAAYAAGLARRQGARLLIVHVVAVAAPGNYGPFVVPGAAAALDEVAGRLRAEALRQAERFGVDAEFVIARGDAAHEIGVIADRRRVDAVVVGASQRAGHRLVGSVAMRLVRRGRWPVTVVP